MKEFCPLCNKRLIERSGFTGAENELECPNLHYFCRKTLIENEDPKYNFWELDEW